MEKKKIKIGLVPKLIIAIIVGILFGQFLPEGFCRFVVTLSGFFSTFLKFVIPLMILAYVTMGIADLSQGAGKLLLITVALAYGSTLIAGSASYLVSSSLFPHFMSEGALDQIAATADASLTPFFSITLEPVMEKAEQVVFVASADSEFAGKTLKMEDILEEPFFLTEKNANYRQALDQQLALKKQALSPVLEISDTAFIILMLEKNHGLSFLPYLAVERDIRKGRIALLHVEDVEISMYRQIFYHKNKFKTREMEEFIRLAAE